MEGYETSPRGKVTGEAMLINIHAELPTRKIAIEQIRYTLVLRDVSNLRKYERSMPGYTMELKGNHAHF
jgi:hypothetical protein